MAQPTRVAIVVLSLVLAGAPAARAQPGAPEPLQVVPEVDEGRCGPVVTGWHADAGADLRSLSSEDFYRRVGRPDLADAHAARRERAIYSTAASVALIGVSVYYFSKAFSSGSTSPDCGPMDPSRGEAWFACEKAASDAKFSNDTRNASIGGAAFAGSSLMLGLGLYYFARPEPIDADEAGALAERYNRTHVVPYVTGDGAGVSAVGHF